MNIFFPLPKIFFTTHYLFKSLREISKEQLKEKNRKGALT